MPIYIYSNDNHKPPRISPLQVDTSKGVETYEWDNETSKVKKTRK